MAKQGAGTRNDRLTSRRQDRAQRLRQLAHLIAEAKDSADKTGERFIAYLLDVALEDLRRRGA